MITTELTQEETKLLEEFRAMRAKEAEAEIDKQLRKKSYKVRAHSIKEAWDLCCTAWQVAEGPQNESRRYADTRILYAFKKADYCYIGVAGSWLRIINVNDRYGKKNYKEVSKSKFCSIYGIQERKGNLPRSLSAFIDRYNVK